jgi:ABC-type polysaccharide/polyol phosphate export permease
LKVWQGSGLCCCCYIVYHYCLRYDREVVHVVVVIFSTITVSGLTEEWSMLLLLYCLPLLFKVWQRSGSCCCFIVNHYCLRFDKGVVHVVVILSTITIYGFTEEWFMLWLLYCIQLLFMAWQKSGSFCGRYTVYHYCLFDRGLVHVVVVILSTITV